MKTYLVLLLVFGVLGVQAQSFPDIEFQTFTDKNGLAHPFCNKLAQDNKGQIWVGTKNGVSRYDGTRFKSFTGYLKGKKVEALGTIFNLFPNDRGGIWLSTYTKLFYLNTHQETFHHIQQTGNVYAEGHRATLRTPANPYQSIQQAIDLASNGDLIKVARGTFLNLF